MFPPALTLRLLPIVDAARATSLASLSWTLLLPVLLSVTGPTKSLVVAVSVMSLPPAVTDVAPPTVSPPALCVTLPPAVTVRLFAVLIVPSWIAFVSRSAIAFGPVLFADTAEPKLLPALVRLIAPAPPLKVLVPVTVSALVWVMPTALTVRVFAVPLVPGWIALLSVSEIGLAPVLSAPTAPPKLLPALVSVIAAPAA